MRISFDIRPLARRSWTGIERYVYHLAAALPRALDPTERLTRYALSFGQRKLLRELAANRLDTHPQAATRVVPLPVAPFFSRSGRLGIPGMELLIGRPDVVHVSDGPAVAPRRAALVATIFDLTPRLFPEHFSPALQAKFDRYFELVRSRAQRVVTISRSAMSDIEEHLGIPPERITVTPLAADPRFRPIDESEAIRAVCRRYGVGERYLISVGTLGPRKNLAILLRAYARLPAALRAEIELVVCGRRTAYSEELRRLAHEFGITTSVRLTGYLPFRDLHHLLCGADASVFPSLYEGFGLPVLEAMACGVPVVASDAASIPEVAGDAGLLIPPGDPDGLAESLERLLGDADLRLDLRRRGIERSALFTWDQTAKATLSAYRSAVGSAGVTKAVSGTRLPRRRQ